MSFWPSNVLRERIEKEHLISPFDDSQIKHGAYQLRLGKEYFLTSDEPQNKRKLQANEQIVLPPGQFALLLTLEQVKVPADSLAFISVRARYKLRGLVNVSGFHVDPGFEGCLKFGVYNAGPSAVVLDAKAPVFSIWFCRFSEVEQDPYDGHWQDQAAISADDVMKLQGTVSSPGELRRELNELHTNVMTLRHSMKVWATIICSIIGSVIAITVASLIVKWIYS